LSARLAETCWPPKEIHGFLHPSETRFLQRQWMEIPPSINEPDETRHAWRWAVKGDSPDPIVPLSVRIREMIPDVNLREFILGIRAKSAAALSRSWRYARSITYRACVIPIQVASWHFQYVSEYGSPGVYALPFAIKIFGRSVDVPNEVHLVYGSIYSSGDVTATGTAPTSFLLAYPAYLKLVGIFLAIFAMLAFDTVASITIGLVSDSLRWAGIGLVTVGCINFMLSDFGTTILSHGTAAALLLLTALSVIEKKARPVSDRSRQTSTVSRMVPNMLKNLISGPGCKVDF
jgi:hypothetical protein